MKQYDKTLLPVARKPRAASRCTHSTPDNADSPPGAIISTLCRLPPYPLLNRSLRDPAADPSTRPALSAPEKLHEKIELYETEK